MGRVGMAYDWTEQDMRCKMGGIRCNERYSIGGIRWKETNSIGGI